MIHILKRLAEASGLHILSNTGYYGAAEDKFCTGTRVSRIRRAIGHLPLDTRLERGIDDTGIKPAFMKIGVDSGPCSEIDAKLVRAAALTHRATGLPIASHTGNGIAAREEIDLLNAPACPPPPSSGCMPSPNATTPFTSTPAKRGAWVEFDDISEASVGRHVDLVRLMKT